MGYKKYIIKDWNKSYVLFLISTPCFLPAMMKLTLKSLRLRMWKVFILFKLQFKGLRNVGNVLKKQRYTSNKYAVDSESTAYLLIRIKK